MTTDPALSAALERLRAETQELRERNEVELAKLPPAMQAWVRGEGPLVLDD